jgi:hypothetical protein
MGYYVSNMIGIRTGGVFAGETDMDDLKARVAKLIAEMRGGEFNPDIQDDPSHCMSDELRAHKGSYVVIAGVFNFWTFDESSEFSRRLSDELQTEVMHMCWDEQDDNVQCQIFLAGKPLFETAEDALGRVLRRIV